MTLRASLTIMADFHQIYVCDPAHDENWGDLWTYQTVTDRVVACEHTVVFGSGRNMDVPVEVMTHDIEPDMKILMAGADHAVSAGLTCTSGTLKIAGCGCFRTRSRQRFVRRRVPFVCSLRH